MDPQEKEIYPYQELYSGFITTYRRGMCSGEEVGEIIVKLAAYYADLNLAMVESERKLSLVARDIETRIDEVSSKPISSAKAKVISDATPECHAFNVSRAHLQNVEMYIGAMKSLQRGLLVEYGNSSL